MLLLFNLMEDGWEHEVGVLDTGKLSLLCVLDLDGESSFHFNDHLLHFDGASGWKIK